ncbi:MAG TPA: hypothetical protein VGM56_32055 [Byssovorax sp.]|jgi:hypothetical protein
MRLRFATSCGALLFAVSLVGCDDKPSTKLAPSATALAAEKPASAASKSFTVDKASSKATFEMDAPIEKIHGHVEGGAEGTLDVDPSDLTKTRGLVAVDIAKLELVQTVTTDAGAQPPAASELQNKHARAWLETGEDTPEDVRKKNQRIEFSIKGVDKVSEKDVTKMTGNDRKVTLTVTGDFLLHGHKTSKTAELEATFHYAGADIASIDVKSTKPVAVGLEEYDVRPRSAVGGILKTLEDLKEKVNKEALVSVEFTVKPGGAAPKADGSAKPAASAAP